ncbi:hypothetical protein [Streptomyces sp. A1499]|nr:hypothetical protein [Streptomyces sp. A1499]
MLVGVVFGTAATVPAESPVTVTDPVAPPVEQHPAGVVGGDP